MNADVLKKLFEFGSISVGDLIREKIAASKSIYSTIAELKWLGIVSFEHGKISLLNNPVASAFKKLFFEGFDVKILSKKNIEFFFIFLKPATVQEASKQTGKSIAQTSRQVNSIMQFLNKENGRYVVSKSNNSIFDFLSLCGKKDESEYFWSSGNEKLLKLPAGFSFEGTLTAFSRFSEFDLMVNPSHNFVFWPKRDLTVEEILVHAIRFSTNANDLVLCILFYLRNKHKINIFELEKNCEKFGITKIWFDIVSFLEDQPVSDAKMFLTRDEFLDKAKLYGIKTVARFDKQTINQLFSDVEKKLFENVKLFFIGGNALLEYNSKNSTKDIDVVVLTPKEAEDLIEVLKSIGFAELKKPELQYVQLGTSLMLVKEGFPRIDLFVKKICNALEFSESMQKRSKKFAGKKLELYLSSLEDIFLLKSVSSRDSDLIDCENILQKTKLNWKEIYSEIQLQERNLEGLKELTILYHFEILEQRLGIKIPITKKLLNLCLEKAILFLAKKPVGVQEILQKVDFPEPTIRNKIVSLVKEKKLKKINGKPFKIVV